MNSATKNILYRIIYLFTFSIVFFSSKETIAQSSIADLEVTIEVEDKTLLEAINQISKDYNVNFVYDKRQVPLNDKVSLSVENSTLSEAIQLLIAPFQLEFAIYGRQISVYQKSNAKYTISGFLKDAESDEALIGANIYDPSTQKGTVSNQHGFFSLTLTAGNHEIVYSYLGYKERRDSIPLFSNIIKNIRLKAGNQLVEIVMLRN